MVHHISDPGTLFLKILVWWPLVCSYIISQSCGRCCLCIWGVKENTFAFLLGTLLRTTGLLCNFSWLQDFVDCKKTSSHTNYDLQKFAACIFFAIDNIRCSLLFCMLQIWNINNNKEKEITNIPTIFSVASLKWRPKRFDQLATVTMMLDFSINVWDLRRKYIPFAYFCVSFVRAHLKLVTPIRLVLWSSKCTFV